MTTKDDLRAQWMFTDYWGAPPDLELSEEENLDYGRALLMAANGDGRLTDAERNWILGYVATGGHSDETLAQLRSFDGSADFNSLFNRGIGPFAKRVCIYDALRAAGSDGELADEEIEAVKSMAARLELTDEVVDELVALYREEQNLRRRRIEAVFPGGLPG